MIPSPATTPSATAGANLTRFAWLSIAAALVTIALKGGAYLLTGSVGLLSDAIESLVNLVAAIVALVVLTVAARGPDDEHDYGHTKAEYFSSGLEGALIFVAALGIIWSALQRLLNPQPIEQVGLGLGISVVASAVNGLVAWRLFRAAREFRSIALQADAKHLMTDVWTSAGVLVGVGLVAVTGWTPLDPILALLVAANITWSGYGLINRSVHGLLDTALPNDEMAEVEEVLVRYRATAGIQTHAVRSRQSGRRRFVSLHILVPPGWTISQAHDLAEHIERDIRAALPDTTVFTHLEPLGDPTAMADTTLEPLGEHRP